MRYSPFGAAPTVFNIPRQGILKFRRLNRLAFYMHIMHDANVIMCIVYYVLLINSSETRNIKHARIVKLRLGTLQLAAMHLNNVNTVLGPLFSSGCPICFVTAPP